MTEGEVEGVGGEKRGEGEKGVDRGNGEKTRIVSER